MHFYEIVVLLQDSSLQSIEAAVEEFKNILLSMEADLVRYEDWGARTIAYPIKRNKKAHYILLLAKASPAAITELERQFKIKDNILRFLTLRIKEINSKPSILAIKNLAGTIKHEEKKEA
jgi:small subunit ribosomal protein S6